MKTYLALLATCVLAGSCILPAYAGDKDDIKHSTAHLNRSLNKASKSANRNLNRSSKHVNHQAKRLSKNVNKEANRESKDVNHTMQGDPNGKKSK